MKRSSRRIFLGILAAFTTVLPLKLAEAYSVSATPNPCHVAPGQTACSVTITWDAAIKPMAQVWVFDESGQDQFFACGHDGTQTAPWIMGGQRYVFSLYESLDCNPATRLGGLAGVTVQGIAAAPVFNMPLTAAGTVGQPFSFTMSAAGATRYSATPLPPGLSVSGSLIQGVPTSAGTYNVTVSATNEGGTVTQSLAITISPAPIPSITSARTAIGFVQSSFAYQIIATNSPTSYSAVGLPVGLAINNANGVISGIPTVAGTYPITLGATNAAGTGQMTLTLTINALVPVITSPGSVIGTTGQVLIYQITASNNPTSYSAAGLPAGLTVNSVTGLLSGVVTVPGIFNSAVFAGNSAGFGSKPLSITLRLPTPSILGPTSAAGVVGVPLSIVMQGANVGAWGASGLPPGLTMNGITGEISGTPTATGIYPATISASNASGAVTGTLLLTINPAPGIVPVITSPLSASGRVGDAFVYSVTATGSPTSFDGTPLPAGLSINTTTGRISGTPTVPGTTNVTLSAANDVGTGRATLSLVILPAPLAAPVITSPLTAEGKVNQAFSYQLTATNNPTTFGATGLPAGLSIDTTTGLISGTPTAAGTSSVLLSATNATGTGTATLNLTVTAVTPGAPVITSALLIQAIRGVDLYYQITATNNPTRFDVSSLPPGLTFETASGIILGSPSQSGEFSVLLAASNAAGTGRATLVIAVITPAPVITSPLTASASVDSPFSYRITATNNPSEYDARPLPPGLSINRTTGIISGTPTTAGATDVDVIAMNDGGTDKKTLHLIVSLPPAPVITSALSIQARVGAPFTYQITASNGPRSYGATGLPAGLSVNTNTGLISGTPSVAGVASIVISARNAGGTGSATLQATILPLPPVITSTLIVQGQVGSDFVYQVIATNSPTSFGATGLPNGLSISATNGLISGVPGVSGSFNITLSATNAGGTGTAQLTATIVPAVPSITSALKAQGDLRFDFSYQITASNNPTSFNATGLPQGLSVNTTTGLISGIPAENGTFNVTISATNAGGTGSALLVLTIIGPVELTTLVPAPFLKLDSLIPRNGTLTVVPRGNNVVSFDWTLTALSETFGAPNGQRTPRASSLSPLFNSAAPSQSFSTRENSLPLEPLHLSAGRYLVTVRTVDAQGNRSEKAEQTFTLFAPSAADVRVFPNPWRADRPTSEIHFNGLPSNSTLKIFTISGQWVRTLSVTAGSASWDLKNDRGDMVASGLYIYVAMDNAGSKVRGKLAIVH